MKPPIAEPFGTPPTEPQERSFRGDFLRSLIGYFCVAFFTAALCSAALFPVLRPNEINDGLSILFAAVLVITLIATAYGLCFSVEVGAQSLRGNNVSGVKREVSWSEITRVRFAWFIFPYALISTASQRNLIWLPLIPSDKAGFARAIKEFSPPDNPLRIFLNKRGM